jgi:hypothetical protein
MRQQGSHFILGDMVVDEARISFTAFSGSHTGGDLRSFSSIGISSIGYVEPH